MASLAIGTLAVTPAGAQTPAPPPAAPAADSAAMERALQQADGPRRRIIEAARLKAAGAAPAPAPAPVAAPVAAPAPRPREPEPVVIGTLPAAMAPLPTVTDARIVVPAAVAPVETPVLPTALADLPPAVSSLPAPRLLKMVEPEFSSRVLRRGGRALEIVVDLTIRTDGSVSDIALRPPVDVSLEPAVLEAMRQWRYDAQPVDRLHSVRLVVNPER